MAALYITSVEPYSGKTAVSLGLAKQLQSRGKKVGYLKPLSTQPWRRPDGQRRNRSRPGWRGCPGRGTREFPR